MLICKEHGHWSVKPTYCNICKPEIKKEPKQKWRRQNLVVFTLEQQIEILKTAIKNKERPKEILGFPRSWDKVERRLNNLLERQNKIKSIEFSKEKLKQYLLIKAKELEKIRVTAKRLGIDTNMDEKEIREEIIKKVENEDYLKKEASKRQEYARKVITKKRLNIPWKTKRKEDIIVKKIKKENKIEVQENDDKEYLCFDCEKVLIGTAEALKHGEIFNHLPRLKRTNNNDGKEN